MSVPFFSWRYRETVELALWISELNTIAGCKVARSTGT
jgi:hypothetical protein